MNLQDKLAGELDDPVLAETLKHFKASVDAWSEAEYSRPHTTVKVARHSWRLALGWALGCVLAAGSLAGGVFEHHQRQELARIAVLRAAQKAAQERLAAEEAAAAQSAAEERTSAFQSNSAAGATDADLLATVDSDVSQEVPAAMEPLAQLMDDNGTNTK